jgi:hypothetical protein
MAFKFAVGTTVSHKAMASKETVFTIVQQMPSEDRQSEPRYKIKAVGEGYERVVGESELNTQFEDRQPRPPFVKNRG